MKYKQKTIIMKKERMVMFILRIVTLALVLIGAINWGLIGIFGFDLVSSIFGDMSVLSRIIYAIVGISALVLLFTSRDIFEENRCLSYE